MNLKLISQKFYGELFTAKSNTLAQDYGIVSFKAERNMTKKHIVDMFIKLFNIDVISVTSCIRKSKPKKFRNVMGQSKEYKIFRVRGNKAALQKAGIIAQ